MSGKEKPDTREKADLVCRLIVDETISANKACERAGIRPGTFYDLCERDPEVAEKYARARMTLLHNYAAQITDIADTPQEGVTTTVKSDGGVEERRGDMIEHRRLQIESRKWMLARLMPRVYGDKQQIEHSGEIGIADRLREARAKREG